MILLVAGPFTAPAICLSIMFACGLLAASLPLLCCVFAALCRFFPLFVDFFAALCRFVTLCDVCLTLLGLFGVIWMLCDDVLSPFDAFGCFLEPHWSSRSCALKNMDQPKSAPKSSHGDGAKY